MVVVPAVAVEVVVVAIVLVVAVALYEKQSIARLLEAFFPIAVPPTGHKAIMTSQTISSVLDRTRLHYSRFSCYRLQPKSFRLWV